MKYKNIKSVAHNLGHSFLSDMNALDVRGAGFTIIPQLLFAEAARSRVPEVRIDFLSGAVEPASVATTPVREAVGHYARRLPELLRNQNVDLAAIRAARLTLAFDYDRVRRTRYHPIQETQEFTCLVQVTDDRGIVHEARPDHWWAV